MGWMTFTIMELLLAEALLVRVAVTVAPSAQKSSYRANNQQLAPLQVQP